jgi:hypothetical protein
LLNPPPPFWPKKSVTFQVMLPCCPPPLADSERYFCYFVTFLRVGGQNVTLVFRNVPCREHSCRPNCNRLQRPSAAYFRVCFLHKTPKNKFQRPSAAYFLIPNLAKSKKKKSGLRPDLSPPPFWPSTKRYFWVTLLPDPPPPGGGVKKKCKTP